MRGEFTAHWSYLELQQILKIGYGVNIIKEPEKSGPCSVLLGTYMNKFMFFSLSVKPLNVLPVGPCAPGKFAW